MKYIIDEVCIQCSTPACTTSCPVGAIKTDKNGRRYIDSKLCIGCEVCGITCQKGAIKREDGSKVEFIPPSERPRAKIEEELCSGCEQCKMVCPFNCIEMVKSDKEEHFLVARVMRGEDCVACRLCVEVCFDKGAIQIYWPDGKIARNFNREGKGEPIKLSGAFTVISDW